MAKLKQVIHTLNTLQSHKIHFHVTVMGKATACFCKLQNAIIILLILVKLFVFFVLFLWLGA